MCDWKPAAAGDTMQWAGLDVHVEVPKGGTRKAKDASWEVKDMPAHYGYFKNTKGADGDAVDVYLGGHPNTDVAWVIDQAHASTGKFDEHKVMAGFPTREAALRAYDQSFSDGKAKERVRDITPIHVADLKAWLRHGRTKAPFSGQRVDKARDENARGFFA